MARRCQRPWAASSSCPASPGRLSGIFCLFLSNTLYFMFKLVYLPFFSLSLFIFLFLFESILTVTLYIIKFLLYDFLIFIFFFIFHYFIFICSFLFFFYLFKFLMFFWGFSGIRRKQNRDTDLGMIYMCTHVCVYIYIYIYIYIRDPDPKDNSFLTGKDITLY